MRGARSAARPRFVGVAALWLSACNGVLGIHAPAEELLDGGVRAVDYASGPELDSGAARVVGAPSASSSLWAAWPMPNPTATGLVNAQSYQVDERGFVIDQITHLEWHSPVDGERRMWREADRYCKDLTLDGGGFRLPTRIELLSLIDFTAGEPRIDTHAFGDTPAAYFWSASRFVGRQGVAWLVNFGAGPGFVSSSDLSSSYPVRCVRVVASAPAGKFAIDGDTVVDTRTDLTWQRLPPNAAYTWAEAKAYCESLDLEGSEWRLPTIKELMTIVDETRSAPAIDGAAFPDTTNDYAWTSSPVAGAESDAWAVSFRFGFDGSFGSTTKQHARCVHAGS